MEKLSPFVWDLEKHWTSKAASLFRLIFGQISDILREQACMATSLVRTLVQQQGNLGFGAHDTQKS